MRAALLWLGLTAVSLPAWAEVSVRFGGGQVDLAATAAPVAEVLDQLARQTGMRVIYQGPAPRQPVTLSLSGRSPAEAVLSLLEGLGLNYALVADPTGRGVQTLIIAGAGTTAAGGGSSRTSMPPTPRRPFRTPPAASPDTIDSPADEPMEQDEDEPVEDPAAVGGVAGVPDAAGVTLPGVPVEGTPPSTLPVGPASGSSATAPIMAPPMYPLPSYPVSPFTPQPFPPAPPGTPATPNQEPEPAEPPQ